jgi:hypothetical protein
MIIGCIYVQDANLEPQNLAPLPYSDISSQLSITIVSKSATGSGNPFPSLPFPSLQSRYRSTDSLAPTGEVILFERPPESRSRLLVWYVGE